MCVCDVIGSRCARAYVTSSSWRCTGPGKVQEAEAVASAGACDVTGAARVAMYMTAPGRYRPAIHAAQLPIKALVTTAGGRVFRFFVGLGLGESVFSAGGCVGARSSGVGTMGASVGLLLGSPTNHTRHGTISGCYYMHAIVHLLKVTFYRYLDQQTKFSILFSTKKKNCH